MSLLTMATSLLPAALRRRWEQLYSSDLRRRFVSGAFWSMLGAFVSQGLSFIATVIVARVLGRGDYGRLGMVRSTVQMFGVYAGFGLGMTANKHVAELHRTDPGRAGRILALSDSFALISGGIVAAVLVVVAPWLAGRSLADPGLSGPLRAGAALLLLTAVTGAQNGALSGFEAFRSIALRSALAGLSAIPFMLTGVYLGGLTGAVWGLTATVALNVVVNQIALHQEMRRTGVQLNFRRCWDERKILFHYSLPAVLSHSLVGPAMWAANAILVNTVDGYREMGTFTAAKGVHNLVMMVTMTMGAPLFPMLASRGARSGEGLGRANMLLTWMLALLVILPLMALPELLEIAFGRDFAGPTLRRTFVLVMFYTGIMVYKQGLARVLAARGLMWWGLLSNLTWAAVLLASAWLLRGHGAVGLALAFVIAYVTNTVFFVPLYWTRNLVPHGTLLSPDVFLLWGAVTSAAGVALLNAHVGARLVMAGLACVLVWLVGRRLLLVRQSAPA